MKNKIGIVLIFTVFLAACAGNVLKEKSESNNSAEDQVKMDEFNKYLEYGQFDDMARFLNINTFSEENRQEIRLSIDEVSHEQKYPYRLKSLKAVDRDFFSVEVLAILDEIKDTPNADIYFPKDNVNKDAKKVITEEIKTNPRIGMTQEQVEGSLWGKPKKINRTVTSTTIREQWVYGSGQYLYFTDGIMTSFQD